MNEIRYRLRRLVFGPPAWSVPPSGDRWWMDDIREMSEGCPVVTWALPSGRVVGSVQMPDGLADELAFRRYARRSGEVVCDKS